MNKVLKILVWCVVASAVIIILAYSYYYFLNESIRDNMLRVHLNNISEIIRNNHGTLGVKNVNLIDGWMTFDYVNLIFNLPQDYLKQNLGLEDVYYPKITISKYAKKNDLDINTFINKVGESVLSYFSNLK
jgi:hypothetical protein